MARDTDGSLQALVEDFVVTTTDSERRTLIDQILTEWTGASSIETTSRGSNINAQHLAVVEAFLGEAYVSSYDGTTDPSIEAGQFLEQAYISIENLVYSELMFQTVLADLFSEILISYDSATDSFYFDLTDVIATLKTDITTDPTTGKERVAEFATALKSLGLADSSNYYALDDANCFYSTFADNDRELKWQLDTINKSYDTSVQAGEGTAKDDAMRITSTTGGYVHSLEGDDVVYGGDGNDELYACSGDDLVDGGAGDDVIATHNGNDTIYGGIGNDNMNGCAGDDVLIGGSGNDYLDGDSNDDTYVFNIGDGVDTITDSYGHDKIIFGQGITSDSIFITTTGGDGDKVINYGDGDSITILGQSNTNVIDLIEFYDGTTYSLYDSELEHSIKGTAGDDVLISNTGYGTVYGLAGNDTISTNESGTHIYYDTDGNDTYIINSGDGTVYIDDFAKVA